MTDAEIVKQINTPVKQNAGKTITNPDGSKTTYDENGYITEKEDKSGNLTSVDRDKNGKITYWEDCIMGKNDVTHTIIRDEHGNVVKYFEYEYNNSGKETRIIQRNPNGDINKIVDYEYENGEEKCSVHRDENGNVTKYVEDAENSEKELRRIHRDNTGKVLYYEEPDPANFPNSIRYNPDGTKI